MSRYIVLIPIFAACVPDRRPIVPREAAFQVKAAEGTTAPRTLPAKEATKAPQPTEPPLVPQVTATPLEQVPVFRDAFSQLLFIASSRGTIPEIRVYFAQGSYQAALKFRTGTDSDTNVRWWAWELESPQKVICAGKLEGAWLQLKGSPMGLCIDDLGVLFAPAKSLVAQGRDFIAKWYAQPAFGWERSVASTSPIVPLAYDAFSQSEGTATKSGKVVASTDKGECKRTSEHEQPLCLVSDTLPSDVAKTMRRIGDYTASLVYYGLDKASAKDGALLFSTRTAGTFFAFVETAPDGYWMFGEMASQPSQKGASAWALKPASADSDLPPLSVGSVSPYPVKIEKQALAPTQSASGWWTALPSSLFE